MKRKLRLGTRGSALALAQSGLVANAVAERTGHEVELVAIKTRGDVILDRPLELVGGKGVFTREIEQALLSGEIDFAVHSMKDLPGDVPAGLVIAAVPMREDPRDVVIGGRLTELPPSAVVGTGSARRRLQLHALRPDLEVRSIRGNVDTRIQKQRSGEYTAVVLAAAGLSRLGRLDEADDTLSVDDMIPAPGQGALAVQCRASDRDVREILSTIDHPTTHRAVQAERGFLLELSGGCSVPAACHARYAVDGRLEVLAFHGDTGRRVALVGPVSEAEALGREAARQVREPQL